MNSINDISDIGFLTDALWKFVNF